MEKLSSGYRINRAADDAAGLAISEKMRGQIGGPGKIRSDTEFNGSSCWTARVAPPGPSRFQVGANTGESIPVTTKDITASATSAGMSALATVGAAATDAAASTAFAAVTLDSIDDAIEKVSSARPRTCGAPSTPRPGATPSSTTPCARPWPSCSAPTCARTRSGPSCSPHSGTGPPEPP